MACSICRARVTKSAAHGGAVNPANAPANAAACCRKRRIQNWPRWYGMSGGAATGAAARRVRLSSRRATRNRLMTATLNRRSGKADSGSRETVRLHPRHRYRRTRMLPANSTSTKVRQ
jgi:hypothetical protein